MGDLGPFIKDVINWGERGGVAKIWSYLISLFSENDDEGGRDQKSQKIDDIFYEWPLTVNENALLDLFPQLCIQFTFAWDCQSRHQFSLM